jgi:HEAT repeat protein
MLENSVTWRNALNVITNSVSASGFQKALGWLRERYGEEPEEIGIIYATMLVKGLAENAGIFALELPAEKIPDALTEIRERLTQLDFQEAQRQLDKNEQRYYDRFAHYGKKVFPTVGYAIEDLLTCYTSGRYGPQNNPNDLIAAALKLAEEDEEQLPRAQDMITRAGAIGLHSHPLWWRWGKEAYGPASTWLIAIFNLVWGYTSGGQALLGAPEDIRLKLQNLVQEAQEISQELTKAAEDVIALEWEKELEPPTFEPSSVDWLIEDLIDREEAGITADMVERCNSDRETFVPALIELATDDYLQLEGSPGDGYAPINAIKLLGQLEAVEAVPALIDIIADSDSMDIIFSAALYALMNIGPPALDPILKFMHYSWDVETKSALSEALVEVGHGEERAYAALLDLWEETTWDEGKLTVAYALAELGGERAIPLLDAALDDPYLTSLEYEEIVSLLSELGDEMAYAPTELPDPHLLLYSILSSIEDPMYLTMITDENPSWKENPAALAYSYVNTQRIVLNQVLALQTTTLSVEELAEQVNELLEDSEWLFSFNAITSEQHPDWLKQTYEHLQEHGGQILRQSLIGVLLSLRHHLEDDYDIADEPDRLLEACSAAGMETHPTDERETRRLFGQAGALILHGRSYWHRWPKETRVPLSNWLEGLISFRNILEKVGQIPLRLSAQSRPEELIGIFQRDTEESPPPHVGDLLDTLIEQNDDQLTLEQLRRFTYRRATIIPHLINMARDKRYWWDDGPGAGWGAILAVRILGELRAAQATDALIDVVAESNEEDIIHDAAVFSLMNIGRVAHSSVKAYLRYGKDGETLTALAEVLGHVGQRNSEDFTLLQRAWEIAAWEQKRRIVALAFGDLGDRRAIPLLQEALGDPQADALDLEYVCWALQRLGVPTTLPKCSPELNTPPPIHPRLIYDDFDFPQRLRHSVWGEPICPGCGERLTLNQIGEWVHEPGDEERE